MFKKPVFGIGAMIMILSAFLTATGQFMWKMSYADFNIYLIIGFICYGLGAVFMIIAFRFGELSKLHPLLSASYVFAILYGSIFLSEKTGMLKLSGIVFIMIGVVLIGEKSDA